MNPTGRKITPSQLFVTLFLSRLFASITYISGVYGNLQPGETVAAMLCASAFIALACVCEAVFLKDDGSAGILMRAGCASNKFFVFVCIFYLLYFIFYCALAAARFNLFISSAVFPDSDMSRLILPVTAGCAFIAYKGIESVSRSSVLFAFAAAVSLAFVFLAASPKLDILNFRGIRPDSGTEILESGFMSAARTAEIASVPIMTPFLNRKPTKAMFAWSGLVSCLLIVISSMISGVLGQFGYEQIFPMYSLTVLAEFGILERLDALITAVWVLCFISKMSYFLFVNSYLLTSLTSIKRKYSPFICAVPVGIGTMIMSKDAYVLAEVIKSGFLTFFFIGGAVLIPLAVAAAEKLRKIKNKTGEKR